MVKKLGQKQQISTRDKLMLVHTLCFIFIILASIAEMTVKQQLHGTLYDFMELKETPKDWG